MRPEEEVRKWIEEELFDRVPVAISVIDRDYHIVEANETFERTYGKAKGKVCYGLYKNRAERCEHCGAARSFEDGRIRVSEEMGIEREGEQTWYMVHVVPLVRPDGSIPFVIEMSTDITEAKTLQKEKVAAERLAAVGSTVAGLAHGIKNIIMGLEGGMYVVNSGLKRNDSQRLLSGWQMLEEEITRISAFAKEFLDFARGREPQVSLVDPNRVAAKVVELFHDRAEQSGIALQADLDPGVPEAAIDEEGIHSCLTNLVSNAIDACEMSDKKSKHVVLSVCDHDGVLCYEVSDDGCGMDYDVQRKVFTNFFSTKAAGRGTGLGLLATRKIVQEHGGQVAFESERGNGSVFRLELRRENLPEPSERGSMDAHEPARPQPKGS